MKTMFHIITIQIYPQFNQSVTYIHCIGKCGKSEFWLEMVLRESKTHKWILYTNWWVVNKYELHGKWLGIRYKLSWIKSLDEIHNDFIREVFRLQCLWSRTTQKLSILWWESKIARKYLLLRCILCFNMWQCNGGHFVKIAYATNERLHNA